MRSYANFRLIFTFHLPVQKSVIQCKLHIHIILDYDWLINNRLWSGLMKSFVGEATEHFCFFVFICFVLCVCLFVFLFFHFHFISLFSVMLTAICCLRLLFIIPHI